MGMKTGCNEAFVVDEDIAEMHASSRRPRIAQPFLKPFLRGQDISGVGSQSGSSSRARMLYIPWEMEIRRHPAVRISRGGTGTGATRKRRAEVKAGRFPVVRARAVCFRLLRALRPVPKIVYQEIQFHPAYALDSEGLFLNNKGFFLPLSDAWLLAVLNSPLMWWYCWRYLPHMKDETLSPVGAKMESLPIAPPSKEAREAAEPAVARLIEITKADNDTRAAVLDSLRMQFAVTEPGNKLSDFASLDTDAFVHEVLKRRPKAAGKLKAADMKALREMYGDEALPIQGRRREALALERRLSNLVNDAYGLTPEEVALLWSTAPPRMPFKPE